VSDKTKADTKVSQAQQRDAARDKTRAESHEVIERVAGKTGTIREKGK
jgi:hypothetical protein